VFKDIIIIDNVFKNPQDIVEFAQSQKFFDRKDHPKESGSNWSGLRTLNVGDIDKSAFDKIVGELMISVLENSFGEISPFVIDINWNANIFFHQLLGTDSYNDTWIHRDDSSQVYAGVVYLKENPIPSSGTTVFINNKKQFVENKFNRLVLYRSDYLHTSNGGFGDNIMNSRLTLNLFFKQLTLSIKR